MRPVLLAASAVVVLVVAAVATGTAAASPYFFGPDVKVCGASTLNGCPFGASPDFAAAYNNTEVEPQVAVNPLEPGRDHRRVAAGSLARWRRRGLTSWMSSNGGDELVEAGRRALERLPGRSRAVRARHRPVGLLRQGRKPVLHRPADRLGRARHLGDLGDELERHDMEGAPDPDRGSGGPRSSPTTRSRSPVTRPGGLCLRDVASLRAPGRMEERVRRPTSIRSRSGATR